MAYSTNAVKGGGLYRSVIVTQLDEVARRIQDDVPPKVKSRVFAATADRSYDFHVPLKFRKETARFVTALSS
ncbi:hypothetical protein [Streptomyces sp. NPDC020747]|uniref:hypothetical protein n=1 Tax=Streptomyces sp. NPDC020747 TaxID=3365086 RepID=UPI003798528C